ncbi:MAG: ATP-binding protein [Pseudomonadota bacterium]|jgi:two-component system phosphate regulon sensor histidine kinase PhoR|nr:two-component sensor histidine kinase [Porticoccaceae bacterium]MEC8760393.1 ATP-binding protein [Pseudomonadota bacterium]|tara:strand:- start:805 stop:2082 length:1278 start_codon:yes stop_codon:yes gene_type:complete
MKENPAAFILFSCILTFLVGMFAVLDYPLWSFPVTVVMSCLIFYMYRNSTRVLKRHQVAEPRQDAIKQEIQETYNTKITYQVVKGLLNILPSPYILIDRNGRLTFINAEAKSIVPDSQIGSHISNVFRSPVFLSAVENAILKDKEKILSFEIETPQFRQLKAHIFFISSSKIPNSFNDIFIQFTDESTHIRSEKIRTDFVANASHELRTPLTSIMGYIETLQGHAKKDVKMQKVFLDLMNKQAGKMERLISDLMSLSRLEIDELKPISSTCSVKEIIEELVNSLKPLSVDNNVSLSFKIPKNFSSVIGDPSQLRQLFSNLIENAIKYSGKKSKVNIYISKEKNKDMFGVVVEDNGHGIAPEHLSRLTERFYRANSSAEIEKEGTGLGLSIVKHILIRHRGKLQIDSKLGKGSKFIAWLPKMKNTS